MYLGSRGILKLPSQLPPNFPGNRGAFGTQAAVQPIAEMANTVVIVDGKTGKLVEAWNQWDHLFE